MLDKVLRFSITALTALTGAALMQLASPVLALFISTEILKMDMGIFKLTLAKLLCILVGAVLGIALGRMVAPYFITTLKRFAVRVEQQVSKIPLHDLIAGILGLILGLIFASLLGGAFARVPIVGDYVPIVFAIIFGYLGMQLTMRRQADFADLFDFVPRLLRDLAKLRETLLAKVEAPEAESAAEPDADKRCKLLDTSVIIDGRIADICATGFLEGPLLIPVFVLEELQHIADSSDLLKRNRGRRGLDILQKIRSEQIVEVEIDNRDFDDLSGVDSKLVRLGQLTGGKIVTNDYNLNKVSKLRGVPVLNVNELANAVKPVVIPGESMSVTVVKSGKEQGQGVAYLDDGTMIVIEGGGKHVNDVVEIEVTSALQTAAGRMIFAKLRKPD